MAENEILAIETRSFRNEQRELLQDLLAIGIDDKDVRQDLEKISEIIGEHALKAIKSAVPVRKFELRRNLRLRSRNRVLKIVTVLPTMRTTSNTRTQISNDELADILEEGRHRGRGRSGYAPYRRSRRSFGEQPFPSIPKGEKTKDWAFEAVERFNDWLSTDPEVK